jgi:predicted RNase H-related nuclease YkuK (DUF458 family)
MNWNRVNHGKIDEPIIDYLEKLITKEKEGGLDLVFAVGTDSQKRGGGFKYATVILIKTRLWLGLDSDGENIWQGKGGMLVSSTDYITTPMTINERMLKEVSKSIEVGYEIWPLLDLYDIPLEIHADINQDPTHPSNAAMKEAVGYITGMGWESKVKPDAYAATNGADKLC